jgi:hypothetical protein
MSTAPQIVMYRDKRLEDMTKEELIEAIKILGGQLQSAHKRLLGIDWKAQLRAAA